MHFEFQYLLADLLSCFSSENPDLLPPEYLSELLVKVEDAPAHIQADLMCDVCFSWTKMLLERQQFSVLPTMLAEKLLRVLVRESIYAKGDFKVWLASQGFLNATFNQSLVVALLNEARSSDSTLFFTRHALKGAMALPTRAEALAQRKSAYEKIEYTNERYITSHNENVRALMKALPQGLEAQHKIMLLATMTNVELDYEVFLKGIGGSENVPWLISKFAVDGPQFLHQLEELFGLPATLSEDAQIVQMFMPLVRLILSFRQTLTQGEKLRRPEMLVAHLIAMIKAFFVIYNHPQVRAFDTRNFNYQFLYFLISLSVALVRDSLYVMNFSTLGKFN
ncbi:MAG: hypothetical protein IT292_03755 [Deltaproteobacteria bacterium]|nr:hypothetical protein [Deltaproteobacteria bacterium]